MGGWGGHPLPPSLKITPVGGCWLPALPSCQELIAALARTRLWSQCAHGRPTVLRCADLSTVPPVPSPYQLRIPLGSGLLGLAGGRVAWPAMMGTPPAKRAKRQSAALT